MARWLKTLFLILVISFSVFSGTPMQSEQGMKNKVCPMKCCKKSAKSKKTQRKDAKYLCRVLVCSQSLPANTGFSPQVNFAPVIIASERVTLFKILFSTTLKEESAEAFENSYQPKQFLPKYIQHQRILV